MKKRILSLLAILISALTYACSCGIPTPILEFDSAEYVFEGKVISKIYATDSLTYTITFNITKHYKKSNYPKTLEFTFKSEAIYTGVMTSCDWNINKGESWLVYANYWKDKLTFGYHCTNSRPLGQRTISETEQKILNNGNSFKLENYIYRNQQEFRYTKSISDIDSIFKTGKIKDYQRPFTILMLFIDKNGNLNSVTTSYSYQLKTDSIFKLPTEFSITLSKPLTDFEKDAIELVKKISKWEIKRHLKTSIPVAHIRHLAIEFDKEKKEWKYEF